MKHGFIFLFSFFSLFFFTGFKNPVGRSITVAVAANMQYAFEALKTAYGESGSTGIEVVLGASGNLSQQIMQGAPFDIFISADTNYPQKLFENGFAADPPKVYANGVLVLWTMKEGLTPAADLRFLLSGDIKKIAIANPQTAPYGTAAEAVLIKNGLFEKIKDKLVYGESISQTNQFIATGAADIGFTAKSIVLSKEMRGKGHWISLDPGEYPPIKQACVLLKYGQINHSKEANSFYAFLFSQKAKAILREYGYIVNQ